MKRLFFGFLCFVSLGSCGPTLGEAGTPLGVVQGASGATRVALLLPLTAPSQELSRLAQSLLDAAQMLLAESQSRHILLLPKDTKGTPQGARAAFSAARSDGAQVIIGPFLADSVRAITPLSQAAGLPVIAFSSDSAVAGNGIFLISFPPEQEAQRVLAYAAQHGHQRFAAFLPRTPLGIRLRQVFLDTVEAHDGSVVTIQTYPRRANAAIQPAQQLAGFFVRQTHLLHAKQSLWHKLSESPEEDDGFVVNLLPEISPKTPPLHDPPGLLDPELPPTELPPTELAMVPVPKMQEKEEFFEEFAPPEGVVNIAPAWRVLPSAEALVGMDKKESLGETPFDALFFPEGGQLLKSIAPLLLLYDIDPKKVQFLGTGQWDEVFIGQEGPLVGGWFAAPDPEQRRRFERRFERRYHYMPSRLATLAYDAMALVATLAQRGTLNSRGLRAPDGFMGLDGTVRFLDGTPQRLLSIIEITPSKTLVIDDPPKSFF